MKKRVLLLLIFTSVISVMALAANPPMTEIPFAKKGVNPAFGVQTANEHLAMTFSVYGNDISQGKLVYYVAMQFFDKKTFAPLSDVLVQNLTSRGTIFSGHLAMSISVNGVKAKQLIPNLKNSGLRIVTQIEGSTKLYNFIDIAAYCKTHPNHFLNLDTGASGCP